MGAKKIGLIVIVVLIIILGSFSAWAYTEIGRLNTKTNSLEADKSALQTQIDTLQTQMDTLKEPKLIWANLKADDSRPLFGSPYLHVYGEIVNAGTNTAYNSKIHVVAYQGSVVAVDTYISLGTINGESWVRVDSNVDYTGGAITTYTASPEWTS